MLTQLTVKGFLDELGSDSPAPGGGSTAALAGGLAAALVAMVARLTVGMAALPEDEKKAMEKVLAEAAGLKDSLNRHVDGDTAAFNLVMQAYRLPRQTEEEKKRRSEAIQEALKGAASHPLKVAGECLQVLSLSKTALATGNPNAASDAGVAALMAYGGLTGAMFNVAINLGGIRDQAFTDRAGAERDRIMSEAAVLYQAIKGLVQEKIPHMTGW
jgi:formiminotetrahydrofolate cyclodeaminase